MAGVCDYCGGSGDRFTLVKDGHMVVVKYGVQMQIYQRQGYDCIGTTECPRCGGCGVIE